jgi:hypothetical protein
VVTSVYMYTCMFGVAAACVCNMMLLTAVVCVRPRVVSSAVCDHKANAVHAVLI